MSLCAVIMLCEGVSGSVGDKATERDGDCVMT